MFIDIISLGILLFFLIYLLFPIEDNYKNAVLKLFILIPLLSATPSQDYFLRGNVIRVLVILIFLKYLVTDLNTPWKNIRLIIYYLLFIIVCIISSMTAEFPVESLFRSLTYLEPLILFILALSISYNYSDGFDKINRALMIGIIAVITMGIIEFIFQQSLLNNIGYFERPKDILFYFDEYRTMSGRITSFIGQPVYTAFFLIVSFILSFYFYQYSAHKVLYIIIILFTLFLIFITGTRAAYPISILIIVTYFYIHGFKNIKLIVFFLISGIIAYSLILNTDIWFYLSESFVVSSKTTTNSNLLQRVDLTSRLFELFARNIWLGLGPGTIQKMAFGTNVIYNPQFEGLSGLENHYLTILADTGMIGFLAYSVFIISIFRYLKSIGTELPEYLKDYKNLFLIVFVFFMIGSFSVNNILSVGMSYLFIILGNLIGAHFCLNLKKTNE